jgi:hypothetical protein
MNMSICICVSMYNSKFMSGVWSSDALALISICSNFYNFSNFSPFRSIFGYSHPASACHPAQSVTPLA